MVFILEIICLKIRDGANVTNFDEYSDVGTHWIGLLYFVGKMKLFISIVLVLNMLLNRLKNSLGIKT